MKKIHRKMLKIGVVVTVLVAYATTGSAIQVKTNVDDFQSKEEPVVKSNSSELPNSVGTEDQILAEEEEEEEEEEISISDSIEDAEDVLRELHDEKIINPVNTANEDGILERAQSLKRSLSRLNDMIYKANTKLQEMPKKIKEDEDFIEGDIKLDEESAAELVKFYEENPQYLSLDYKASDPISTNTMDKRKIKNTSGSQWTLPIKYTIMDRKNRRVVKCAISIWQKGTCVRFVERKSLAPPGIIFKGDNTGCWSNIGKKNSSLNIVNLGSGCQTVGTALHEIGHALGFYHEQNRPERNRYVTIFTQNIKPDEIKNFLIKPSSPYGTLYDYGSIMHYGDDYYAKSSGLKTMEAKLSYYERTMGQNTALTFYDLKAINYYYCQDKCSGGLSWSQCRNGGYRDPNNCNRCKCPEGWIGTYCTFLSSSRPWSTSCGNQYLMATITYQTLISPGYTSLGYTSEAECSWRIKAPPGKRVRLHFAGTFDIVCHKWCMDFVEIRLSRFAATGRRFCCSTRPAGYFVSSGTDMLVFFRTYSGLNGKGFEASYRYI